MLIRDEDLFVESAIRNALNFCDRIIVADHESADNTFAIVTRLANGLGKIDAHRITETRMSHELIQPYINSNTWIFGVDGDEVYDPAGLRLMREEITTGKYDDWW